MNNNTLMGNQVDHLMGKAVGEMSSAPFLAGSNTSQCEDLPSPIRTRAPWEGRSAHTDPNPRGSYTRPGLTSELDFGV